MGAKLDAIRELQEIELQITDIRRQLARKERAVAAQNQKLDQLRKSQAALRDEVRRLQVEADAIDLDLKARSAHLAKVREQLNSVRTNKEYAAMLAQLNTEKADLARMEASGLELMGKLEGRKAELAALESQIQAEESRLSGVRAQLNQTDENLAGAAAELENRRKQAAAAVDPAALEIFNRVSERYEGEAMARVVRVHPRRDEFICEGCNMSVVPDRANALLTRDEVQTCRNCGRILYIERN